MLNNTIDIYPTHDINHPYVGKFNAMLPDPDPDTRIPGTFAKNVKTIIILDVSGSMGNYVTKIITRYIPDALLRLNNNPFSDPVHLITFSDTSHTYRYTGNAMRTSGQKSAGMTYMAPCIDNLKRVIDEAPCKQFRILTISDGDLNDQIQTINAATKLASEINGKYMIRSTAIRLFTSSQQPDTRGLASILQLNNVGETNLLDFECPSIDEEFVNVFSNALTDNLGSTIQLMARFPIFIRDPWDVPTSRLDLQEGWNTFWIQGITLPERQANSLSPGQGITLPERQANSLSPGQGITLPERQGNSLQERQGITDIVIKTGPDENVAQICIKNELDCNNFENVLKDKIAHYMERLKLLKIVDMPNSRKEIERIVNYFNELENIFSLRDKTLVTLNSDTSIGTRLNFFKNRALRKSKSIFQKLATIANHDKVSELNAAQQANYLRNATTSSNSINLAKRAIKQGLDFDMKVIQEVKEMTRHLHELDDIDDSDHMVSFYSQETTLGAIRSVGRLDDENLCRLSASEILMLINIVGVPCDGPVGDFPDPKTYHPTDLMPGSYISMSDVLMARQHSRILYNPYNNTKAIINVIPVYDDDRIQQFLMKYAPNILEYTASLGMRNMIIGIPSTYCYTVVGGVWWMVREFQDNQSEINAKLLIKFIHTYKTAVGNLFDHVINLIKPMSPDDKKNNLSFCIGNNGVTNMIGPLIAIQNDDAKMKLMPDILRALYGFEFYQVMKKFYRTDSDGYIKRKQLLDDLLGIDFAKYGTRLPALFESLKVPEHHTEYHVNETIYQDIVRKVYWIDYICGIGKIFSNALKNDIRALMNCNFNREMYEHELEIDFSLAKFKLMCIVQGLMYDTLASRYDKGNGKMKIEDIRDERRMNEVLGNYIKNQYHAHYQSELAKQNKQEIESLTLQLVDQMIETHSMEQFNKLFREGLTRNHVHVVILNMFKQGFDELKNKLFDPLIECNQRDEKLRVLITGHDRDKKLVYNEGNTVRMSIGELELKIGNVDCIDMWTEIYEEYIEKNIHLYRTPCIPNRHTHCNPKPSYWAYGYKNLKSYFNAISKEEQDNYCKLHTNCCGIWNGVPVKWA
jgi:hypothetical protein